MNYFHLTWRECTQEISFKVLLNLSLSIPEYSAKDEGKGGKSKKGKTHIYSAFDRAAELYPKNKPEKKSTEDGA